MDSVLIFGGGLQALSVARSLFECGYFVVCLSAKTEPSSKSRFVHKFIVQSKQISDGDFLDYFCEIVSQNACKVAIPMSDTNARFLSKNKEQIELKTFCKCAVPSFDAFEIAASKSRLLDFCAENNLPCPRNVPLKNGNHAEAIRQIGFPALIKPDHSVGARGITLVEDADQFYSKIDDVIRNFGSCSLQQYINHRGKPYYNVMIYRNENNEILASCVFEIVRYYPINGGSSSLGKTIIDEKLVAICTKTLALLNWVGFADFDVLKSENGEYKIIEINPRVPASLRAAAVSGVNFPEIIVNDCLKNEQKTYNYSPNRYLRYLGLDLAWFLASPKRFSAQPSWFKFFGKKLYYQEGGIKDWRAMLFSLCEGVRKMLNPSFRKSKKGL